MSEIYTTFVFSHADEEARKEAVSHILGRWKMLPEEPVPTRISAIAEGDSMSVCDAARMALECNDIDQSERCELALDLLEEVNWDGCLRKFSEWELEVKDGALADARKAA